ncbi:MAG: STAS domain-containing protein [Terriglobales bacterium]|jgi:anti-sigma B factor antagonist
MLLRTSSRIYGAAFILDCNGRIVFGEETALLRQQVLEMLTQTGAVVLNLSNVSFIDSSGVGELIRLLTTASRDSKKIVLAGLTGRVRDVLQITKLASCFETYSTPIEAAESVSAEAAGDNN